MREERLIVDGMLGSLARKLRMYGFDTVYSPDFDDKKLLEAADSEERILLTSDKILHANAFRKGFQSILVMGENDADRLVEVFSRLSISGGNLDPANSRCPLCNGEIGKVDTLEIAPFLPTKTLEMNVVFYRCSSCAKIYWQGSHWKHLGSLSRRVQEQLHDTQNGE